MGSIEIAGRQLPTIRIYYGDAGWLVPFAIVLAIIAGALWVMARMRDARDKQARQDAAAQGHDTGAFQYGTGAAASTRATDPPAGWPGASTPPVGWPDAAAPAVASATPSADEDPRTAAWAELFDPATTGDRLAELAASHPEFAAQIAAHQNCYPELRAWAQATSQEGTS